MSFVLNEVNENGQHVRLEFKKIAYSSLDANSKQSS